MKYNAKAYFLFLLVLIFSVACSSKVIHKPIMPDFCQIDERLPYGGRPYCGPVAVSNVLVYLSQNGFPNLSDATEKSNQTNIIKKLGSKEYMNTTNAHGTAPVDLIKGLKKYVLEKGYKPEAKWHGRANCNDYKTGNIATKRWILEEGQKNNIVLHVGWYKYDVEKNFYKRIGGHFVPIEKFNLDDTFFIKDSSGRSCDGEKSEKCKLEIIKSGTLSSWGNIPEQSAKDFVKLYGIEVKENADFGIVDGALSFMLDKI